MFKILACLLCFPVIGSLVSLVSPEPMKLMYVCLLTLQHFPWGVLRAGARGRCHLERHSRGEAGDELRWLKKDASRSASKALHWYAWDSLRFSQNTRQGEKKLQALGRYFFSFYTRRVLAMFWDNNNQVDDQYFVVYSWLTHEIISTTPCD